MQGGVQVLYPTMGHEALEVGTTPANLPDLPNMAAMRRTVIRVGAVKVYIQADGLAFDINTAFPLGPDEVWVLDTDFEKVQLATLSGTSSTRIWYLGL
jgi:hypothetical protein